MRAERRRGRRRTALVTMLCAVALGGVLTTGQADVAGADPLPGSVVGLTHTERTVDDYPPDQVEAPTSLLASHPMVQNQYLMGWGADNPEPVPGVYNWASLDERMALISATHGVAVLTLAGAPDWMKGGQPGQTDWSRINAAPTPAHYADFAALAAAAAARYPQVRFFQVWSELKGLYASTRNRWDYEGYTALYNAVYDAVKRVRPDAQLGGPYIALDTWSSAATSPAPSPLGGPWGNVDRRDLDVLRYWQAHRHGAGFLVVDGSTATRDAGLVTDPFTATTMFTTVTEWLVRSFGLPVWWAEFYPGHPSGPGWEPDGNRLTALTVDAVARAMAGGASQILLWQPQESASFRYAALWTEPSEQQPARVTPLAGLWAWLAVHGRDATVSWSAGGRLLSFTAPSQRLVVNLGADPLTPPGATAALPGYGSATLDGGSM